MKGIRAPVPEPTSITRESAPRAGGVPAMRRSLCTAAPATSRVPFQAAADAVPDSIHRDAKSCETWMCRIDVEASAQALGEVAGELNAMPVKNLSSSNRSTCCTSSGSGSRNCCAARSSKAAACRLLCSARSGAAPAAAADPLQLLQRRCRSFCKQGAMSSLAVCNAIKMLGGEPLLSKCSAGGLRLPFRHGLAA